MTREQMVAKLMCGLVDVTFTKKNGELRKMTCTLKEGFFPPLKGSNHKRSDEVIPVWDVENNGWRSFRVDSVVEFV